ncbi:hypothetical protein Verru16b_01723 [Lacunisphaera limnophila]|uniref:Uncharacterized protein n=1 Tax=Lacunisphaera limnophila TaxID=1838286 RepID=A0A1D8AUY3_9BACT|nr:hypothetical protein [Lacunisphaera limnophila]AOS44656.1 hypothetical protein Verru16b_01723 [Lacunisphaera limnophila]
MKMLAACLVLLVATSFGQAQAVKPSLPGKAAPAGKKAATEEKVEEIKGLVLTRPNGHFLGLTLQDGKFKLSFYNEKKKPEKVDVTRATARWPNMHGPGDNRTILNPAGDGTYLMGTQFVRAPYTFKLFLTLLQGEGEEVKSVESHTVDFRG